MIADLKPYPAMRDSGVPGLGEVPSHWDMARLKTVFREVDRRSGTGEEPLLSLRMQQGLVDHHAMGGKRIPPSSLVNYKRTQPGEIVMNRMRAAAGLFAATPCVGLVSPDYAVLRPRIPVDLQYFVHLFRTPQMMSIFRLESRGLGTGESGFLRLYTERFGMLAAPVPPLDEQAAIVRFLDHADRRIRRYIRAKQKLINLLEEQRQAIMHHAVTRGLNPNVRLKPTGVEWLADVPQHWEILALRRRWRVIDCKHLTVPFVEEGIPLASVREAQAFELRFATSNRTTPEWYERLIEGGREPRSGDLIYCRNVGVGAAALVTTEEPFAMGQDVCLIRSLSENPRWLNYFLRSKAMADQLALILVGSTFNRINVADVKALLVAVPPRAEQDRIAEFLDEDVGKIDAGMGTCRDEQTFLREYRTRLIADVVTGKLDVREAAAKLPAAIDEAEPLSEAEIEADAEDTTEDLEAATEEAEA